MRIHTVTRHSLVGLVAGAFAAAACDLSVSNPGPVTGADLDDISMIPALVTGMSVELSNGFGRMLTTGAVASDELKHSGNSRNDREIDAGRMAPEHVIPEWDGMQVARWVAEDGIERMQRLMGPDFENSPLAARAYLLAGFANRTLGENVCVAVIDGGAAQHHSVHFERAEQQFTEALRLAQALGHEVFATAARGGRASVLAWQGRWSEAVADATLVPDDFRFDALYADEHAAERSRIGNETVNRREYTVWGTRWAEIFDEPRVPWDTVYQRENVQTGHDGLTPFFRQGKYGSRADPVALTKGAELLLLRAEAALRQNDIAGSVALIDAQRELYELDPVEEPADLAAAWELLQYERAAALWLEARRFWDLRRWKEEGRSDFLAGRVDCVPPSIDEIQANKNLVWP